MLLFQHLLRFAACEVSTARCEKGLSYPPSTAVLETSHYASRTLYPGLQGHRVSCKISTITTACRALNFDNAYINQERHLVDFEKKHHILGQRYNNMYFFF